MKHLIDLICWFDDIGRRRGQEWLNRFLGDDTDDFDEIQDVFPDAQRAD
jgi:hypothetical protein